MKTEAQLNNEMQLAIALDTSKHELHNSQKAIKLASRSTHDALKDDFKRMQDKLDAMSSKLIQNARG